ncbi:MAG TPA: sucrase ferredoxin [Acidimicrobiales bacterium]
MTTTETLDLRCSTQARSLAADPLGTAVHARALLLVEVPLPWPADIGDHPALAGVVAAAKSLGARVQGLVPDPERAARGEALVVLHTAPDGPFRGYERRAAVVPAGDLASGLADLGPAPAADVLVCSHGARDRCCGSLGTSLHAGTQPRTDLHVRRTSHLGGHRFAPTAVLLPQGTAWAWLDDALLGAILDRRVPPAALAGHYRGSLAMPHPAAQVVEGAVFAEVGWDWLDHGRQGSVVDEDGDRWTVRLDSTAGTWHGVVERTGTAPQPVCGQPLAAAKKSDDHLRLVALDRD